MTSDREILLDTFRPLLAAWRANMSNTALTAAPKEAEIAALVAAIEQTQVYQASAGESLFTGVSGITIAAPDLAPLMFGKAGWWPGVDAEEPVDWLLKVLSTQEAAGSFVAAIWGLMIDEPTNLPNGWKLIPYELTPDSYLKRSLESRERPNRSVSFRWVPGLPTAALVKHVRGFPYRAGVNSFATLDKLAQELLTPSTVLQGKIVGQPLLIGHWFSYDDRSLDILEHEDIVSWEGHEIAPYITSTKSVTGARVTEAFSHLDRMCPKWSDTLNRAQQRFISSQCRHEVVDRILDLAIAFEIALSGKEANAPLSWKVAIRTALLIGGSLEKKLANRAAMAQFYTRRSEATHGSGMGSKKGRKSFEEIGVTLERATDLFRDLLSKLWTHTCAPNWNEIELSGGETQRN